MRNKNTFASPPIPRAVTAAPTARCHGAIILSDEGRTRKKIPTPIAAMTPPITAKLNPFPPCFMPQIDPMTATAIPTTGGATCNK